MKAARLFPKITRGERRFVWIVALAAMLVTAVPPLVGVAAEARHGGHWNGVQILSPGDFGVYLSYISQAAEGRIAFENMYATEALPPVINLLWAGVGGLGALLGIGPVGAFHVARTALIPVLAFVAYLAAASFLDAVPRRKVALLLFMFSAGVGAYFMELFPHSQPEGGSYEWPIDLWVGESHAFLSMVYSPHFVASFALILAVVTVLRRAFATMRASHAIVAGLLGALLFQFHPFHAPTLYVVFFAYLAVESLRAARIDARWWLYAAFVGISLPSVAYHYALSRESDLAATLVDMNLTLTPSPVQLVLGFGVVGILAIIAMPSTWRSGDERGRFLVVWAVAQTLLLYAPITFQRRLVEGLQFPLVILATGALFSLVATLRERIGYRPEIERTYGAFIVVLLFLPSSFAVVARNVDAYRSDHPPIFYWSPAQHDAIAFLRERTPEDAKVLSHVGSGSMIAGWADRKVYVGHWVNSGDIERKRRNVMRFLAAMPNEERGRFMAAHGLTHLFMGPEERAFLGSSLGPSFTEAFSAEGHAVYEFTPRP